VQNRQAQELKKLQDKAQALEHRKLEAGERQDRLDQAVENYAFRP